MLKEEEGFFFKIKSSLWEIYIKKIRKILEPTKHTIMNKLYYLGTRGDSNDRQRLKEFHKKFKTFYYELDLV